MEIVEIPEGYKAYEDGMYEYCRLRITERKLNVQTVIETTSQLNG